MEPLELVEGKEEINGSDGLVGIDGNYKANELKLWNWRNWWNSSDNGMQITLITIKTHPIIMELQIDLTELFEPDDFLERIQCMAIELNK